MSAPRAAAPATRQAGEAATKAKTATGQAVASAQKYHNEHPEAAANALSGAKSFLGACAAKTFLSPGLQEFLKVRPSALSLTHSLAHSLTRSLTRSLARSLTHSLTHSLTQVHLGPDVPSAGDEA